MKLHYPQDIPNYAWEFFGRILRSLDDISEDVVTKFSSVMNLLPLKILMLFNRPLAYSKFSSVLHVLSGMEARKHSFRLSISQLYVTAGREDDET